MIVSLGLGVGLMPTPVPIAPFSLCLTGRRLAIGGVPLVMR
ncbi:hypothetical protein [Segnochrobactrum spirostomi]|nr:hypothetical protein [Segnochrobactrum spirostomi]